MIDTNLLLDWLLERNAEHTERIDKLFAGTTGQLHVPDAVFIEASFVMERSYKIIRPAVAANLDLVLGNPLFDCNAALLRPAIDDYVNHPAWSLMDAYLVNLAVAQSTLPVWTFDKKLVSQSSGRAKTPA